MHSIAIAHNRLVAVTGNARAQFENTESLEEMQALFDLWDPPTSLPRASSVGPMRNPTPANASVPPSRLDDAPTPIIRYHAWALTEAVLSAKASTHMHCCQAPFVSNDLWSRSGFVIARIRGSGTIAWNRSLSVDLPGFNLNNPSSVSAAVMLQAVINVAAYARVGRAQQDGVATAAGRLVQTSTYYVFDGSSDHPYREGDPRRIRRPWPVQIGWGARGARAERRFCRIAHGLGLQPVRRESSQDHIEASAISRWESNKHAHFAA
jgi:hypothetical protein